MMKYDKEFYERQKTGSKTSASVVLKYLFELFCPASVVDVGCGTGVWLETARTFGVSDILGIDGEYVIDGALMIDQHNFYPVDLETAFHLERTFDMAMSLEVAEHLSHERAEGFIADLCALSDVVLFSAALPYQGGAGHVNENWLEYWAEKFAVFGFIPLDFLRHALWNNSEVEWWYRQNLLLYVRETSAEKLFPGIPPADPHRLSMVHPEFFLWSLQRSGDERVVRTFAQDRYYYRFVTAEDKNNMVARIPGYGQEFGDAK
ncbi:methyltransferase domain-containing protein [Sulfuricurvum sp.]|uniref:methyltransferase domain-containing protein n=1 Tax=Sulfuricurvum sp. TaxID=2025608 RepID=UPI0026039D73|nr:methyltransferase domain-containing protein [Sulfuricurvum sp.]MDD2781543.1 methyltransferase domain-containing protein [Sulfuricurvum sp.]